MPQIPTFHKPKSPAAENHRAIRAESSAEIEPAVKAVFPPIKSKSS